MVEIHWVLALSAFAALVRYAQQFTGEKETRPQWEWGIAFIHAGTGSFAGLLAVWAVGPSWEVHYVWLAIAFAGYGGKLTLDFGWEVFTGAAKKLANSRDMDKDEKG